MECLLYVTLHVWLRSMCDWWFFFLFVYYSIFIFILLKEFEFFFLIQLRVVLDLYFIFFIIRNVFVLFIVAVWKYLIKHNFSSSNNNFEFVIWAQSFQLDETFSCYINSKNKYLYPLPFIPAKVPQNLNFQFK